MKKIMWIVAVLPVVVASMMLQVIPDMIPHKIGIFIFPIVILCVTFFWHLLIGTFEKKTVKASTDKERMEANSSARVLCVVGLSQAIMFGIMNYFLYLCGYFPSNNLCYFFQRFVCGGGYLLCRQTILIYFALFYFLPVRFCHYICMTSSYFLQ
jgi:hypothetical protein